MSVDRTFTISVAERRGTKLSAVNIINCFLEFGWSLYSAQGKIIYTAVGDSDDFEYFEKHISRSEYFHIVEQKELRDEVIAFAMFYEENCISYRMNTLIMPSHEIVISPDDETRKMLISDLNILDTNWYFSKILPPLLNSNILIEAFSYAQY